MNETEIIQHPQIDGLRIFFDTVDYRTPHVHEEFELIWLMEGRLSVQAGPFRHVAQSGEMVLFDPQQTHEFHKVEESCTFLCLQVAPTMLAGCFPAIRNIRTGGVCPGIYLSPDVFAQVQRGLLNVMRAYLERPACYELCCAGHVHLLMYRLLAARRMFCSRQRKMPNASGGTRACCGSSVLWTRTICTRYACRILPGPSAVP